jgi:hypothetical protein
VDGRRDGMLSGEQLLRERSFSLKVKVVSAISLM